MNTCSNEGEYLRQIIPAVQRCCKRYGYLPSVLIAQSCLENGYGISSYWDNPQISALIKYNNMVGIKTSLLNSSWTDIGLSVWPGKSLTKQTPEEYGGRMVTITDSFRIYDNIEQSFADYLCFMRWASNYGPGGVPKYGPEILSITDPETLIKRVSNLGYATGSTYPTSVMKIVKKHGLTKYDDLTEVTPTSYYPKEVSEVHTIIDRTKYNTAPRSRGSNSLTYIVVHYLGVPNADNPDLYNGGYGGHFYVSRKGEIYKAVDPRQGVVWHCGGGLQGSGGHTFYGKCTNYNSIGIEVGVCYDGSRKDPDGDDPNWYYTTEAQESLAWLCAKLMKDYGISLEHVIRHYDVTGKICPNPYVLNNKHRTSWTWSEFKAKVAALYGGTSTSGETTAEGSYMFSVATVKKGSNGNHVKLMQRLLKSNGCRGADGKVLTLDGDCGDNTVSAINKYQKKRRKAGVELGNNGKNDSMCGPKMWADILGV